jgi:hypothetical protein
MIRLLIIALVLSSVLSGCAVSARLDDGYQLGDITKGMNENRLRACGPMYRPVLVVGKWLLIFIGYPVPPLCPSTLGDF